MPVDVAPQRFLSNQVYSRGGRSSKTNPGLPVINGRLVSLSSLTPGALLQLTNEPTVRNAVVINFPAMPDSITLARRANYFTLSTFTMPDGFHQYQYTDPLEIPFTFELHAFDTDYCRQGALSLLDITAQLHALTLPISHGTGVVSTQSAGAAISLPSSTDKSEEAQLQKSLKEDSSVVRVAGGETSTSFPVAVLLDLIYAGEDAPGIRCVGYVKDVNVQLFGPFLTPPGSRYKNLPTAIEASFTFVHRPSHTNKFVSSQTGVLTTENTQAYADDVKNNLYNTVKLVRQSAWQGFQT